MTKFKLGLAASAAAILAFGVAACGQTAPTTEEPAAEVTEPAAEPAADPAAAPADPAAAPADPAAAPAANP